MNPRRRRFLATVAGTASTGLAGCSLLERSPVGERADSTGTLTPPPTSSTPPSGTPAPPGGHRYTSLTPGGNRVVAGTLDLGAADPVDLPLGAETRWVIARPEPDGPGAEWVSIAETGAVSAFRVRRTGTTTLDPAPSEVEPATPPVLRSTGRVTLLSAPAAASKLTHPLPLGPDGLLYVRSDGVVVRDRRGERSTLDVDALPDARPRLVGDGRVALLAGATDRYAHGALGDETEAGRLVVLDAAGPELRVTGEVRFDGTVVEGLAPLVAGDDPALYVTVSGPEGGARQAAYAPDGSPLTAGRPVGRGFRWRHQLCLAPFAPDGTPELAAVRTPHVGGTAEFHRREGDELAVVATEPGVSSHALGSRVLDGGFAADVDGDGRPELVVPDDERRSLVVVTRTSGGASTALQVPAGGHVISNVHAVRAATGLQIGVGRQDGLRVWA